MTCAGPPGDTITAALTLNLGKGGISVRTMSPLPTGSPVRLRFRLPGAKREIEADAKLFGDARRTLIQPEKRAVPEFSEKQFGYGGFLQFCKAAQTRGLIEMTLDDTAGDYVVTIGSGPG